MNNNEPETFEDRQDEVGEIQGLVTRLDGDLSAAESCETEADLDTNLDEALASAQAVVKAIKALMKKGKK